MSAEAEATIAPSGRHATRSTWPVWPESTPSSSPVAKRQSLTVVCPEEASMLPSGDQRTQNATSWCPVKSCICAPVVASQMRMVASREVEPIQRPSGDQAMLVAGAV